MNRPFFYLLIATLLSMFGQSVSAAVEFDFSFIDVQNGNNLVEGFVSGLSDNGTGEATSVTVTSSSLGFGVGRYIGSPSPSVNEWIIVNGVVTSARFTSFGIFNTPPDVTCCSISFVTDAPGRPTYAAFANQPGFLSFSSSSVVTFTRRDVPSTSTPVPTMPIYALALTTIGLVLVAIRSFSPSFKRR